MPKRPTQRAQNAEFELRNLLLNKGASDALPTVRELGEQLGLSYSTVSRLLQGFVKQGHAWQHPNGRFYSAQAGETAVCGLPIVVVGRQIQNWSRLYQEILEGVSEVCTAKGCPLIFLSSSKLVRHSLMELAPVFATAEIQTQELLRISAAVPRLCAGILFDHIWHEDLILAAPFPSAPRLLLARPSMRTELLACTPDFNAGAKSLLHHFNETRLEKIFLAVPFEGDQAVDAAGSALLAEAARLDRTVTILDCSTRAKRQSSLNRLVKTPGKAGVICTEDNVASLMQQNLKKCVSQTAPVIFSMQGTGVLDLRITKLRYDYRRLGREAVMAAITRRKEMTALLPALIPAEGEP